jgi:hypothetical protein
MRPGLGEVVALLTGYREGSLRRDDLEHGLADLVMHLPDQPAPQESQATPEEILAFQLAEAICGMTGPEEDLRLFIQRVLRCIDQLHDPDDTLDMLPPIRQLDSFSILVSKHARGVMTAPALRSVIAKRFRFDQHRQWLESAAWPRNCLKRLEEDDYEGAQRLLEGSSDAA